MEKRGDPESGKSKRGLKCRALKRLQEAPIYDWMSSASLRCHASPTRTDLAALRTEQQVPQKPFTNRDIGTHVRACCFPGQGSGLFATSLGHWRTKTTVTHISRLCAVVSSTGQEETQTHLLFTCCVLDTPWGSHAYGWKELQSSDPPSTQMGKSRLTKVT